MAGGLDAGRCGRDKVGGAMSVWARAFALRLTHAGCCSGKVHVGSAASVHPVNGMTKNNPAKKRKEGMG